MAVADKLDDVYMMRPVSLCIDEIPMNITGNYGDEFHFVTGG
jgi:hypothetical protein